MTEQHEQKIRVNKMWLGIFGAMAAVIVVVMYLLSPIPTVRGQRAGDLVEVHKNDTLVFVFDRSMNHAFTERAFAVTPHMAGQFSWEGNTLTFDPAYALEKGSNFQVTIGRGARAWYGKGLSESFTQAFNVSNDPEVSVVSPLDGVTIRPAQILTVLFDRPMRTLTGSLEVPNLLMIEPPIKGEYHWLGTSGFEFVPTNGWDPATTYTVTLPKSIVLQDGSFLREDYVWHFATPNLSVALASEDKHAPLDKPVKLSFNYPVDPSILADALTIYEQTVRGVGQAGTASDLVAVSKYFFRFDNEKGDARVVEMSRVGGFELGKRYQFVLPQGFTAGLGPNGLTDIFSRTVTMDEKGFRILDTCPDSGGTKEVTSSVIFQVNNPPDENTFETAVTVAPELENMEVSRSGYAPNCKSKEFKVGISGRWAPSTTYTITISRALTDIYGQPLESAQTYTITTNPYPTRADLSGYSKYGVLASQMPRVYQVRTLNMLEPVTAQLCRVSVEQYLLGVDSLDDCEEIGSKSYETTQSLNEYKVVNVDLDEIVGSDVPNGMYQLLLNLPGTTNHGRDQKEIRSLLISDTALSMKKDTAGQVLVWANDMQTGEVVPGLTVELFSVPKHDVGFTTLQTAVTDADGLAIFEADEGLLKKEIGVRANGDGHYGLVLQGWSEGISPWNFGLGTSYGTTLAHHIGYLYTDRRVYRPDQMVYFKGVLRKDVDALLELPDLSEVEVIIEDSSGTEVSKQVLPVSSFGTFHGSLQLDPSMELGMYKFSIAVAGEKIFGSFQVLEYRRPDFDVTVGIPTVQTTSGDSINIPIQAEYYYGTPLSNATVDYTITRRSLSFQPMDRHDWYSFSEIEDSYCYWHCDSNGNFENIKKGAAILDENGLFTLTLPVSLTDYPSSAVYFVNVTVTDINKRQVSANEEFNVHKGDFYLGIRPDYKKVWNSPTVDFDIISIRPDGTELPDTSGTVTLYKRTWANVQKEGTNGDDFWEWIKTDTYISTASFVTDQEAKTRVSFSPEEDGQYVAVVSSRDVRGRDIRASVSRWVDRGRGASVRVSDDHTMKIVQNQADYAVGDKASLLVETPYENTKALVTIERDTIHEMRVIDLGAMQRTIDIPIEEWMVPNVYVSVLAVKGGEGDWPEFRLGYVNLQVDTTTKVLNVDVTADKTIYRPGEIVTLSVSTKRSDDSPTSAEVSLAVVDDRIIALLGSIDQNILGRFWFSRDIGVFTAQTLTQLVKKIFVETEGGGGKGGDEETGTLRSNFQDTAFWRADLVTDESGKGTISFPIADNLTSWQVLAIGTTKDTVVGSAQTSLITRRDLMVEPVLPRIVRQGDTVAFATTVVNITDKSLLAKVELSTKGAMIKGSMTQMVWMPANSRRSIFWNVAVPMETHEVHVRATVEGGGLSDSFEVSLPSLEYSVPETVSASNTFGREASETIEIPQEILTNVGEIVASVTSNVGTGLLGSFEYLTKFAYGCSEQTAGALVGSLLYEQLASAKLIVGDNVILEESRDKVKTSIKKLVSTQNPNGGWGFWPENKKVYPYLTAYVFWGLTQAEQAGYAVDENVLDLADQYLHNYLASPMDENNRGQSMNERAQVLFMLSERDSKNLFGYVATVFEERELLSLFGKSFLAMALETIDGNASRASTVLDEVRIGVVYQNPSTAYITEDTGYNDYFMNSDIRSTSLYLQALMRISPKDDDVDRLVRWLMSRKVAGYWHNTQNTAMVLQGLTEYVERHPIDTENLDVQVFLDDSLASTLAFEQGDLSGERSEHFPIPLLLESGNTHTFDFLKDSEKRYFYDLSMTVYRQIVDIVPFENGFTILADVYALEDSKHEQPLTQTDQGETVRVHMKLLVPKEHRYVAFEYHLPAGLEPIDFSLETSPQNFAGETQQCVPDWSGKQICRNDWEMRWWWRNAWDHIEQRDDRVFLFAENLEPGIYEYEFIATAVTPGEFRVPPARVYEFYNPLANSHNEGKVFEVIAK